MDEISVMFPRTSRSLLYETITETLGFHKLRARWVPKQPTDQHKVSRVPASKELLERYGLEARCFSSFRCNWRRNLGCTLYTKRRSEQWRHPQPQRHKGIILFEFSPQGETINAARYCETLKNLRRAIHNNCCTTMPDSLKFHFPDDAHGWEKIFN